MNLEEHQLKKIYGGAITAAFLSAVVRGMNLLLELGRSIGSAINRLRYGTSC